MTTVCAYACGILSILRARDRIPIVFVQSTSSRLKFCGDRKSCEMGEVIIFYVRQVYEHLPSTILTQKPIQSVHSIASDIRTNVRGERERKRV